VRRGSAVPAAVIPLSEARAHLFFDNLVKVMKWHLTSRALRLQERSEQRCFKRAQEIIFWIVTPILIPVTPVAGGLTILVSSPTAIVTTFLKISSGA